MGIICAKAVPLSGQFTQVPSCPPDIHASRRWHGRILSCVNDKTFDGHVSLRLQQLALIFEEVNKWLNVKSGVRLPHSCFEHSTRVYTELLSSQKKGSHCHV